MMEIKHIHEKEKGRFTVNIDGNEAGYLKYDIMPNGSLKANGTLVYDDYREQKLGRPLFDAFVDYLKSENKKVFPTCPYVVSMFKKHPELSDLLDNDYKN